MRVRKKRPGREGRASGIRLVEFVFFGTVSILLAVSVVAARMRVGLGPCNKTRPCATRLRTLGLWPVGVCRPLQKRLTGARLATRARLSRSCACAGLDVPA